MMFGAESIPEREAIDRFRLRERLQLYGSGAREAEPGVFVYFAGGDVRIDGDLGLDWTDDRFAGHIGLVVDGDLTVTGNIINENGNAGPFLLVRGNLRARNVVAGGAEFHIEGDADIEELLLGHYNDGTLAIDGTTRAQLILSDDHSMHTTSEAPYWSSHAIPIGMPLSDYLHADVELESDDDDDYRLDPPVQQVDADALIARLQRGLPVVRAPNDPRPRKSLAEWRADVGKDGVVLRFVPRELIDRELCLAAVRSNGYAIEYVPKALLTTDMYDAALAENANTISEFPEEEITPERARVAVTADGANLRYVPEAMRTPELCRLALEHDKDAFALRYIPEKNLTPELALRAVRNDPMDLIRIPEPLRTVEVCAAAVQDTPWMLHAVPEAIRDEVAGAANVEPPAPVSPEVRALLDSRPSKLRLFLWVLGQRPMKAVLLRGLLSVAMLVVHLGITVYVWKSEGPAKGIAAFIALSFVSIGVSLWGNVAFRRAAGVPPERG
jgi:Domain of unknown function (DUF4116)